MTTDVDVIPLSGLFYCLAAAAAIAGEWEEVAATMIAATTAVSGSSSYCSAAVTDVETESSNHLFFDPGISLKFPEIIKKSCHWQLF